MHHAGVQLDEGTKFLNDEVCIALHVSELQTWDFRAVQTADSDAHLRPTAIGRCNYSTICLVGFAVIEIPEDGRGKVFWLHRWHLQPFEEGINV
jgi:hypothetical protein